MNYSILQSVYRSDNADYLRLSIESMLSQTLRSNDYVIVEDGPLPEELEAVVVFFEQSYLEVSVVRLEKNVGLGKALNAGLAECKNELVARMDSDDISVPERCERLVSCFQADPELDIVGSHVREFVRTPDNVVGERRVPIDDKSIHEYLRRRDPFNHPAVMFRKSKVLACGSYGDYRKNQDTDLWFKLMSHGCKGANVDDYLLLFRFDDGTYRKRKSWTNTKTLLDIRWKAFKDGQCSFWDFVFVAVAQTAIYLMPTGLQRFIYKHILR